MVRLWRFWRKQSGEQPDRCLAFLNKEAGQEYVLRVEKQRLPEEDRHTKEKARITQDHTDRGMLSSTAYTSAIIQERIQHLRNRILIVREQLFAVVEARGIRLRQKKVKAIIDYLRSCFSEQGQGLLAEYSALHVQHRLPAGDLKSVTMQIDMILTAETVKEVALRVADIENKRKAARRALVIKWAEKLMWVVVGAGVLELVRWLSGWGD